MTVMRSHIRNAGLGLFAPSNLEEGRTLGRFSGSVRFESDFADVAENWALMQADDRLVLLRGGRKRWAVVDVRGSVFEWANCSVDEESQNLHVSEHGWVTTERDVEAGTELVWWYGRLHAATAAAASDA